MERLKKRTYSLVIYSDRNGEERAEVIEGARHKMRAKRRKRELDKKYGDVRIQTVTRQESEKDG